MFSIKQSGQWWSWMTLKGHFSYVSIFPSLNCADYKKPWNTCSSWAFLFVVCIIIMYVAGIVYVIINIIQLHKWQPCVMMSPTRLVWRIHWSQLQWWICSLFFLFTSILGLHLTTPTVEDFSVFNWPHRSTAVKYHFMCLRTLKKKPSCL